MNNNSTNNSTGIVSTFCARCGAPFDPRSRYCMKCGNINPDHPSNKNMSKYIKKNRVEGYRIGSGQTVANRKKNFLDLKASNAVVGEHTGNFAICFAVNMVGYLVASIGTILYYLLLSRGNIEVVVSSNVPLYLLTYSVVFFYLFSFEVLFIKLNRRWWLSLIPIINMCVLVEAVNDSRRLALMSLIPVVGQIIWIMTICKLGASFQKSGVLTLLFPFIMIPVIAFGGSAFHWVFYVSNHSTVENDYIYKKVFSTMVLVFTAISVAFLLYTRNVVLVNEAGSLDKAYIMGASDMLIDDVVKKVNAGEYTCDFNMDTFYFHFDDLSETYNVPFEIFFSPVEAYIKVEKVKEGDVIILDEYNYYISATDGNIGYDEVSTKDLKYDVIKNKESLSNDYDSGNHCYLNN